SPEYYELNLESLTISAGGTLQVIGVNPILFRVRGIVQVGGTLDVAGGDGEGGIAVTAEGGEPGPAGGAGGSSRSGVTCSAGVSTCNSFAAFLTRCGGAKSNGPFGDNGEGPGRGMTGGEIWSYGGDEISSQSPGVTGTGGGGGSHGDLGTPGQDIKNAGGSPGSPGPACGTYSTPPQSNWNYKNSSVIGVRGQPGPIYGDRLVELVYLGGSGGGAGGSAHGYASWTGSTGAGGAGGGGGGSLAIFAAGDIQVPGGLIDASGGDGGKGVLTKGYSYYVAAHGFSSATGSGGGGSGGTVVLISGADINVTAGILDARGGTGGEAAHIGTAVKCVGGNAGGDGGKGFIFLMDADGLISGLIPGQEGEYDTYVLGVLTISGFNADRFSSIQAITELFGVGASNPAYTAMAPGDVLANVTRTEPKVSQSIRIFASTAKGELDEPLLPNPTTEMGAIEIALVTNEAGAVNVEITGDMSLLNPTGAPNRDAFMRIDARFEYDNPVEAALGPFASIDQVDISFTFNG
ncbi:MAG: hypothetical protein ACYTF8_06575, partial [Planctomycetota bacterium]